MHTAAVPPCCAGNILVRVRSDPPPLLARLLLGAGSRPRPQLVMLDHGIYFRLPDALRQLYCQVSPLVHRFPAVCSNKRLSRMREGRQRGGATRWCQEGVGVRQTHPAFSCPPATSLSCVPPARSCGAPSCWATWKPPGWRPRSWGANGPGASSRRCCGRATGRQCPKRSASG